MPLFKLEIKCVLENISCLYCDDDDFSYVMKVKCSACGEVSPNWHHVNIKEEIECTSGHSIVNFRYKCKLCSKENTIRIVPEGTMKVNSESCTTFTPIATFDCRGLEPVEFTPMDGWQVKAEESGKLFSGIDMKGEKDWVDFDEIGCQPVGIYEFESRFVRVN